MKESLIDDLWINICLLLIRNRNAPSFLFASILEGLSLPIGLKLLEVKKVEEEIFAHYAIVY